MIGFNQQIATTSEICLVENASGTLCLEKEIQTITTFEWFNFLILFFSACLPIIVIALFKKRQ